jgi:hypothetical protein
VEVMLHLQNGFQFPKSIQVSATKTITKSSTILPEYNNDAIQRTKLSREV